jgi:hypothetical protein
MRILALDIATRTGWAVGAVGQRAPMFGSIRFGKPGASHDAIFANALKWASANFKTWRPDRIMFEAPLPTIFHRGTTNISTTRILFGLPAIMQAVAYLRGVYDVRDAAAKDVRIFFLGNNLRRDAAKAATIKRCRMLGWDVEDDNAADACALWLYACNTACASPGIGMRTTPLFTDKMEARVR